MLIYVYLLSQISVHFNNVEDVRYVKRVEVPRGFRSIYRGDIMKRDVVDVDLWSKPYICAISLGVGSNNEVVNVITDFSSSNLIVLSSDISGSQSTETFNYSQSTTFKRNESFYSQPKNFFRENGTELWGQDDVTIGNGNVKELDLAIQNVSTSSRNIGLRNVRADDCTTQQID